MIEIVALILTALLLSVVGLAISDKPDSIIADKNKQQAKIKESKINVKVDALPKLSVNNLDTLPEYAGIYFFLIDNTIVYVGETNNLHRRLTIDEHHVLAKVGHNRRLKIAYKSAPSNKRARLREEITLIKALRPCMNLKDCVD